MNWIPKGFEKLKYGARENSPFVAQSQIFRAYEDLFYGYQRQVPPVPLDGGQLLVGIGMTFVKFLGFDEIAGTVSLALNLHLSWEDPRLAFDSKRYFPEQMWHEKGDEICVGKVIYS